MIIPFYIALTPEQFQKLDASSADDRGEFLGDTLEQAVIGTPEAPSADVDKFFDEIQEAIARETDDAELAGYAVFGKEDWDSENATDGMRFNDTEVVARVAEALSTIDAEVIQSTSNMRILVSFYADAAKRGDAMAILYN